jgi:membrane protease YdiL (CAAX protease family)
VPVDAAVSALLQVALLAGVPFLGYSIYHQWRHRRRLPEIAGRAGLRRCPGRYLALSAALALATVLVIVAWGPPLEPLTRPGSPLRPFVGLGLTAPAVARAVLYGAVQTAFAEEVVFRGLIAGSLARRLSAPAANVVQALIFFVPHLFILAVAPEVWGLLPVVFAGALVYGWVRIKSGSILGPWLMHAAGNVTMALEVAVRTAA